MSKSLKYFFRDKKIRWIKGLLVSLEVILIFNWVLRSLTHTPSPAWPKLLNLDTLTTDRATSAHLPVAANSAGLVTNCGVENKSVGYWVG